MTPGGPGSGSVLCPREPDKGPEGDWPEFLGLHPGAECLLRAFSAGDTCAPGDALGRVLPLGRHAGRW